MRVEVLHPLTHEGVDYLPGDYIELAEDDVRRLLGAVAQEETPPAPDDAA